jgi:L-serine dehydratase
MHLFDIIGPIMIGPSSSHTAGAARIGRVTRQLLGEFPTYAAIDFHGSFSKTWQGHGTDRAVLGGLLDMAVDDERLRDSRELARLAGMEYVFRIITLKSAHPNTMIITARGASGAQVSVQAASTGGGSIRVQYLNGLEVGFSGENTTLVIRHRDTPGAIAEVSGVLAEARLNIATMRVFRREAGGEAVMALEMDQIPDEKLISRLSTLDNIEKVTLLSRI